MTSDSADPVVDQLAALFAAHPAWQSAARHISVRAMSTVYFRHRPGESWHLEQRDGTTLLLPGSAADPDFVFRFTPASVERLAAVEGGIGEFAVVLFELMLDEDPELHVGFRIVAGFLRLAQRGYVRLLLAAGPPVLAFGATHGVRSIAALRRLVASLRERAPETWEDEGGA